MCDYTFFPGDGELTLKYNKFKTRFMTYVDLYKLFLERCKRIKTKESTSYSPDQTRRSCPHPLSLYRLVHTFS